MKGFWRRLLDSRFRISTQLYLGIAGAVAMTFAASVVGWFSFERVGEVQSRVNEGSVPALAAAFDVAQQSGALVAFAPRLLSAADPDDLARISGDIASAREAFEARLATLHRLGGEEDRTREIGVQGAALVANVQQVLGQVLQHFSLTRVREELRAELDATRRDLEEVFVPAIDDQFFFAMTGYRARDAAPAPRESHFSEEEFNRYRGLMELSEFAAVGVGVLSTALNVSDPILLEPLRERFESVARAIDRRLADIGMPEIQDALRPGLARLVDLGLGLQRGLFDQRARELELIASERALLAENRDLEIALVAEVDALVTAAEEDARDAARASEQAIDAGGNILLALSAASIVGAVLLAWLFVGRVLLRRLERLAKRMRGMAEGDLEGQVAIDGRDEVADMAAALEVFRQAALEARRLNLVEELAGELQSKNAQLEDTLADLHKAQDQIVVKEKLAALGELTAGVAHEIRNPLNFVKNFSESSEELVEELLEEIEGVMKDSGAANDDERRGLIAEIGSDVTENLKRIRQHGGRADRIVESMLMMGRGAGEAMPTDINAVLDEHARLAYHSARATDKSFRLEIKRELDPEAGEIEAIPQDLGRVFLNMVGNACHATDDRRKAAVEGGEAGYVPTMTLKTQGFEERVEVRIRDNGCGMPPDVAEKIFNPFFTTKPTGKGTGLGLALSNDIVRKHGGGIRVETEAGAFTEMIVSLPRASALADAEADSAGEAEDEDAAAEAAAGA